ncbi:TraB/GumN family protein [Algoriphagus sp. AK58]|uniref:TraB/GumN family protein n=1 Tax=Algoriphagus sp. AK58 TaxID=1406877 RepID=UPI002106F7A3|nr:TraB/GumN family protein [Algoriphagus sp. AK58]
MESNACSMGFNPIFLKSFNSISMSKGISKKITLSFLLVLILTVKGFAQDSSLLWRISGNGLNQDSYLFGTIHLICKDDFFMNDQILKAFQESKSLVMELDLSDPQLNSKMQQLSLNPGMKNIQLDMREEDAKIIDAFFIQNYGAGLAQLGILKPFVLSSMALIKSISCTEVESYESFFTAKAIEDRKQIIGLETVEIQIGIFDQIPFSVQIQEMINMISDNSGDEDFQKMIKTYLSQDVEALYHTMNSEGMIKDYRELMLDQRNQSWIKRLEQGMEDESLFVAVGAGHLGGEMGVISLLRKAGYQVEPVLE